jgi:hypothetical protein
MGWPGFSDYNSNIQNPRVAFRNPKLKDCAVQLKPGKPWPWPRAGANAIVYRLDNGSWSTAVRVFMNAPKDDRESHYRKVLAHLQKTRPRCMVDFGYEPGGIQVNAQWLPLLTMEWVEGDTLGEWMRVTVQRKDVAAIRAMAEEWVELMGELARCRIAHGDLQHGNVMVRGGKLVLVDYDGVCVPELVGHKALEFGQPAYQHPGRRNQETLSLDMDHFSAWIILISLRAVAADLALYERFVVRTEVEYLLFSDGDIRRPESSGLWKELLKSPDAEVRGWADQTLRALAGPIDQVPPFGLIPHRTGMIASPVDSPDQRRPDNKAHDVFISYSTRDDAPARAVYHALGARGIRCWMAPIDILPGTTWGGAIMDAIEGSRVMVLIYSSSSNESEAVMRELYAAADNRIPVLPFRIENCPPSKDVKFLIQHQHWLDALTPPLEQHIDKLFKSLKTLLRSDVDQS